MAFPTGTYINEIAGYHGYTAMELEQLYSLFQGWLSQQHKETGAHKAVTADSVAVSGAASADTVKVGDGATHNATPASGGVSIEGKLDVTGIAGASTPSVRVGAVTHGIGYDQTRDGMTGWATNAMIVTTSDGLFPYGPTGTNARLGDATYAWRSFHTSTATVVGGVLNVQGTITPAQITSNQDNYNPSGLSTAFRVHISSDAARDITGLAAQADGRMLWIYNTGAFSITLKYNSASSSDGNKIVAAAAADAVIRSGGSVLLQYSTAIAPGFWFVLGA